MHVVKRSALELGLERPCCGDLRFCVSRVSDAAFCTVRRLLHLPHT